LDFKAVFCQFYDHGLFVNAFKKSKAKLFVYTISRADDLMCNVLVFHSCPTGLTGFRGFFSQFPEEAEKAQQVAFGERHSISHGF
jgi:hypothetical protein